MLAGALGADDRVCTTKFKMCPRSPIAIAEHVKYGNTASEMLSGRLGVATRHVHQSVEPVCLPSEIQISRRIRRLGGNALEFPITIVQFIRFQVGFGSNQPRLANGLAVADDLSEIECFPSLGKCVTRIVDGEITAPKRS